MARPIGDEVEIMPFVGVGLLRHDELIDDRVAAFDAEGRSSRSRRGRAESDRD